MTDQEKAQVYDFYIRSGYSEYEAREASYGNEWDTAGDIAYRDSLYAVPVSVTAEQEADDE